MSANYKQLIEFQKKIEKLSDTQIDQFVQSCCKELAARLLAKVIKRSDGFKNSTGTFRRGWTAKTHAEAVSGSGKGQSATEYANSLNIKKVGDKYHIDIINPVEYASYVEYGHRTKDHQGWVSGRFMLTISETELNNMTDAILQKKLNKFIKEVFDI